MTPRQKEIYDWIVSETVRNQRPPTIREIAEHFGIKSPNGAVCHLVALERKGMIRRTKEITRGIIVLKMEKAVELKEAIVKAALKMADDGDEFSFTELKSAVKEYRNHGRQPV